MMSRNRWSQAALTAIAAALVWGALAIESLHPSAAWLADALLCAAFALFAYAGGWIGGAIALVVVPIVLSAARPDLTMVAVGEWIEWLVVCASMAVARDQWLRHSQAESKLRALFASMNDVVLVLDAEGKYVEVVPTNGAPLAAPRDAHDGRAVHDVLPHQTADLVVAQIGRALSEGRRIEVDYSMTIAEKTTWWSASVSPIDGEKVLWVARDITLRKRAEDALLRSNDELEERVAIRTGELLTMAEELNRELALRKEAEEALRRSEKVHRAMVEQARDVIFTLDPTGVITSLNPVFARTVGWPVEDWIGRDYRELLEQETRTRADAVFAQAGTVESLPLQRAIVQGNDRQIVFEVSLVNLVIDDSSIGFLGLARDVTEREAAAEQLRRSERMLAESQAVAKLGSWEHDLVHHEIWWSDEHYRLFGVEPRHGAMSFEQFLALLPPAGRAQIVEDSENLLQQGSGEWEMTIRVEGQEKILSCQGRVSRDREGQPIRIFGTAQDVTELKRAECLLRESEERFRLMGMATNDVVWDWDPEADRMWWGESLRTLFGYEASEATAPSFWSSHVHPNDRERIVRSVEALLETEEISWSAEYRFRKADDSYATVFDRGYIVRDAEGKPVRIVGAMMDMTERKQMAEQLAQANRVSSLGRIAASIAHEFNNVLMGIQPNLEVIRRRAPVQLSKTVDHVLHSVSRGKRVTDEILNFTRRVKPTLESVDLRDLLARWEQEIRPILGNGVALEINVSPAVSILADPLQINQVLTNLAINSRDAMKASGFLTITAEPTDQPAMLGFASAPPRPYVHLSVTDTGAGMTPKALQHLFEPLFTTKPGGTGLGLAVTYQIVTRHDGFITAESTPGSGSTFHLLLPAASLADEAEESNVVAAASCRRILIVEDETAVASGLESLFEIEGMRVLTVATGSAVMPAIEDFSPDAVILDVALPDISGVEVYRAIEARWPDLPVLFSSEHGDEENLQAWLRKPNVALLLKPYGLADLERALFALIERTAQPGGTAAKRPDAGMVM